MHVKECDRICTGKFGWFYKLCIEFYMTLTHLHTWLGIPCMRYKVIDFPDDSTSHSKIVCSKRESYHTGFVKRSVFYVASPFKIAC